MGVSKWLIGIVAHLALGASALASLFFLVQPNGGGLCADQFCVHPLHVVTDSYDCVMAQEQNSSNPFIIFHQLGSGAHGTDPCSTPSSGDGTGSSERSSADGVQRIARSFRTGLSGSLVT